MYVSDVPQVLKRTVGKLTMCQAVPVDTARVQRHSSTADGLTNTMLTAELPRYVSYEPRLLHWTVGGSDPGTVGYCCTTGFNIQHKYRSILGKRPNSIPKSEIIGAYSHLPHYM